MSRFSERLQQARNKDEYYMLLALIEAEKAAEEDEVPVGALLVRDDTILAQDHNRRESWHDPTAHAEIVVLKQAAQVLQNWRLEGSTLYVTLEPCPMCAGALVNARVQRLVYALSDPKAGACTSVMNVTQNPKLNHRLEVEAGLFADDAKDLLQSFFRKRR